MEMNEMTSTPVFKWMDLVSFSIADPSLKGNIGSFYAQPAVASVVKLSPLSTFLIPKIFIFENLQNKINSFVSVPAVLKCEVALHTYITISILKHSALTDCFLHFVIFALNSHTFLTHIVLQNNLWCLGRQTINIYNAFKITLADICKMFWTDPKIVQSPNGQWRFMADTAVIKL